jgi:RecB family exonuclease
LRFVHAADAARERLVMVRRAVDDDGREVAPSPYWVEVARRVGRPIDHLDGRTGARGEVPGPAEVARSGREALRALALDGGEAPGLLADAARRRVRPVGVPAEAFHDRRCFRVTELESYLRCPYGWFHASVLRPQELEVVIDPRFEGTLGHEVLGRLYARMRDAGVGACRPATLGRYREELAVVLAAVVADERPPHGDAVFDATAERLGRHLAAVLGRDAERDSPLVPTVIETRMEDEAILAPVAAGLVLSGQVDRVDVGREGAVVIDYKRTKGDFSAAGDDVRKRLQLPLYGVMAERALSPGVPAVGGLYVGLLTSSLNGAVRDDVPGPAVPRRLLVPEERWREIVGEAVDAARGAVTRIREGRLDPPSAGGCGYWCMCGDLWR